MSPNPLLLSKPVGPISSAVFSRLLYNFPAVRVGLFCKSKAATPAAWGAAADVPKKLANPGTVVATPSGATISGLLARGSGVDSRLPARSNRIGVAPDEEKEFKTGGDTPNCGVLKYAAAPTASAPTAFAWPNIVLLFVANSLMVSAVPARIKLTYFIKLGLGPEWFTIIRFTVSAVDAKFVA